MRRREVLVIAAALVGAVVGFYSGGGQGSPEAILDNPDLLLAQGNGPMLWAIVGALFCGWLANRWVEHQRTKEDDRP
jgi:hypothetical protein